MHNVRSILYTNFRICWRPLNMQLADYEVEIIEAFVAKTIGK